jgi:regulator of protease activity HflC (stomatin/prohibitin superfamily)
VCSQQGNVGMVTSCGKFQRKAGSGFHLLNPFLCEFVSGYVTTRIQQLDVSVETKTKDNVFVTCIVSVQYQVRRFEEGRQLGRYRARLPTCAPLTSQSYVAPNMHSVVL